MSAHPIEEPQLPPDFAARVLELADRRMVQRRRIRLAAGAAGFCLVIAATVLWANFDLMSERDTPAPGPVTASGSPAGQSAGRSADASPDALGYLFPDAEPLARFSQENSAEEGASGAGALFSDDD
jgi:hypothetical protein